MLETLIGAGVGGILRVVPEVMSFFDKKNERKHESEMMDKQIEADKNKSAQAIQQTTIAGQVALDDKGLQALIESIKAQAQLTGNKLIDGLNSSVRPVVTYLIVIFYIGAKVSGAILAHESGISDIAQIIQMSYSPDDQALLAGVLNFWFLDRVIKYQKG